MERTSVDRIESIGRSVPEWGHVVLRLVLVALVANPALSKVVTYGDPVSFFDAIGMPAPTVMVVVAGLIEVGAVVLFLAGVRERLAAVSLIPVMPVAILYVGPDWKNLGVLLGAMGLLALGTDFDAIWHSVDHRPG